MKDEKDILYNALLMDSINNPKLQLLSLPQKTISAGNSSEREKTDPTLLFMTLAVTMTSENEMPIVAAYNGKRPTDIRGIHRVKDKAVPHLAPHFFFSDDRIRQFFDNPFKTEKILSTFDVSIGIDFSMTM